MFVSSLILSRWPNIFKKRPKTLKNALTPIGSCRDLHKNCSWSHCSVHLGSALLGSAFFLCCQSSALMGSAVVHWLTWCTCSFLVEWCSVLTLSNAIANVERAPAHRPRAVVGVMAGVCKCADLGACPCIQGFLESELSVSNMAGG